jgi:HSP20 family molecular chaperone IbpA
MIEARDASRAGRAPVFSRSSRPRAGSFAAALVVGVALLARADEQPPDPSRLPVQVTETPATVRLRILLPDDVPPGSVEVQLAGRKVVVLGRTVRGQRVRSRAIRLSEEAVEDGAEADYDPDGSLTITLQKKARHGEPEAIAPPAIR